MKRIVSLFAIVCALVCAGEPVKLAPSQPEDFTESAKLEVLEGALVIRKPGTFISKQRVAIDSAKPGILTLEYKLAPEAKPENFVVALDALDAKGRRIVGAHIFPMKTTETELAADAKKLGAYGIILTTWDHLPNWLRDASFAAGCVTPLKTFMILGVSWVPRIFIIA